MFKGFMRLNVRVIKGYLQPQKKSCVDYAKTLVTETAAAKPETSTSVSEEPKWQLFASAFITRTPITCPEMKQEEKDYDELVKVKEVEVSFKSNHEMRLLEDKIRIDLLNLGNKDDVDIEEFAKQTGTEFEDASTYELNKFQFGTRLTESDHSNDLTSLDRSLGKSLVLTIKKKLGSDYQWIFPEAPWKPGETLRQTTERVIEDICGSKIKVKILGNSPCGFYKYKYPKEVRKQGYIGAKIFFFSGHVVAFDSEGLTKDAHLWLTHEELKKKLRKSYCHAISQFLIPDD